MRFTSHTYNTIDKPVLKSYYLGNVLATISDVKMPVDTNHDGTIDRYVADIRSATDYAAFGAPLDGRTFTAGLSVNGFNGKRKDDEIYGAGNAYDYGARMYDPRLGRPLSIDPLSNKFAALSTYQYFSNNPILLIDLDGREGVQYLENTTHKDGTTTTQRVVEFDVYVAISDKAQSTHFNAGDVDAIKNNLNKEYNTGNFTDKAGNKVVFRPNVKTFNADEITPGEKAAQLRKDDSNIRYGEVKGTDNDGNVIGLRSSQMGLVLAKNPALTDRDQGSTVNGVSSISPTAANPSHTQAHEPVHFLLTFDPNNPGTNEKFSERDHNKYGGILQVGKKDEKTGKVNVEPLNQSNVDKILEYVPETKPVNVKE